MNKAGVSRLTPYLVLGHKMLIVHSPLLHPDHRGCLPKNYLILSLPENK